MKSRVRKQQSQHKRPSHLIMATGVLLVSSLLLPNVYAAPPATVASCQGIGQAYPVLGAKCSNNYDRINHAPATEEERASTYRARVTVMTVFRQASLCNGMYGASRQDNQRFLSAEKNHLIALTNLYAAMENEGDALLEEFDEVDLNGITIKKQQCK